LPTTPHVTMVEAAKIPVIDISAEGEDQKKIAKELVEAAITHGFLYIKNTGSDIPVDAVDAAFNMVRKLRISQPEGNMAIGSRRDANICHARFRLAVQDVVRIAA
jgi:hypothetical protein